MPFLLPLLQERGRLESTEMRICNVGSRKFSDGDDYGTKAWGLFASNLTIYGFDADADACEMANEDLMQRQVAWKEIHLPYAIASQPGQAKLHVTQNPVCSSLYEPNEEYLKRFPRLPEYVSLDFTLDVETTNLDALYIDGEIEKVDFLQIDVQGAELLVLQGAEQLLENVLAVQVEVEFSPLYRQQPLFADVDTFLRQQGFSLFAIHPVYEERSPFHSPVYAGQLVWGEAIYMRDPFLSKDAEFLNHPEKLFKLACISDALEFTDYTLELLEYLTLTFGSDPLYNFADPILVRMSTMPSIIEVGLSAVPMAKKLKPYCSEEVTTLIAQSTGSISKPQE